MRIIVEVTAVGQSRFVVASRLFKRDTAGAR
jgi:hypothetical protein